MIKRSSADFREIVGEIVRGFQILASSSEFGGLCKGDVNILKIDILTFWVSIRQILVFLLRNLKFVSIFILGIDIFFF